MGLRLLRERDARIKELEEELREYGPDYVDKLQQDIDERNVRISKLEAEMREAQVLFSAERNELDIARARIKELEGQISDLAKVLLGEFGGPTQSESACEMAARVLREQATYTSKLEAEFRSLQARRNRPAPRRKASKAAKKKR